MIINSISTGNKYVIKRNQFFEVTCSSRNGSYVSIDLEAALLYIIKIERAAIILNLSKTCFDTIRKRLSAYNLSIRPEDEAVVKNVLLRERIITSYYEPLLSSAATDYLEHKQVFDLDVNTNFPVFDELEQMIREYLHSQPSMTHRTYQL